MNEQEKVLLLDYSRAILAKQVKEYIDLKNNTNDEHDPALLAQKNRIQKYVASMSFLVSEIKRDEISTNVLDQIYSFHVDLTNNVKNLEIQITFSDKDFSTTP
jgi:hypothetical protein